MTRASTLLLTGLALSLGAPQLHAGKDPPPSGVIAASVGDVVVLADPKTGSASAFESGTVGWLYEGPGGVLFAPDLLTGKTTVLDLRIGAVSDRFDGVTVPHFGPSSPDRYVVVAGDVLEVSYPNRAVISRVKAEIDHPWQVLMISDSVLLVLEKGPAGLGPPVLTAVDMVNRQLVYRRPLPGRVERLALSREFGLLALADAARSEVALVEPATLQPVSVLTTAGPAADVIFLDERGIVAAVSPVADAGGELRVWLLKAKKGELTVKKERHLSLGDTPVRIAASPGQDLFAVTFAGGTIDLVTVDELSVVRTIELPGVPRDVVWCDPSRPGPMIPEWSDEKAPELRMDP